MLLGIKPGEQRGVHRQSPGGGGNCVFEERALGGELGQVRAGGPGVSVSGKMVGAQGVHHDDQDVGGGGRGSRELCQGPPSWILCLRGNPTMHHRARSKSTGRVRFCQRTRKGPRSSHKNASSEAAVIVVRSPMMTGDAKGERLKQAKRVRPENRNVACVRSRWLRARRRLSAIRTKAAPRNNRGSISTPARIRSRQM